MKRFSLPGHRSAALWSRPQRCFSRLAELSFVPPMPPKTSAAGSVHVRKRLSAWLTRGKKGPKSAGLSRSMHSRWTRRP